MRFTIVDGTGTPLTYLKTARSRNVKSSKVRNCAPRTARSLFLSNASIMRMICFLVFDLTDFILLGMNCSNIVV